MRSLVFLLLLSPFFVIAQADSLDMSTRALQAYKLYDDEICIGYPLDNTLSVDAIAHMFKTTPGAIYRANKLLGYRPPQHGDLLNIPVDMNEILGLFAYSPNHVPVVYTVQQGETMFRIARRHFDLPLDILMQLNHLESPDLSIGQMILLGYIELEPSAMETPQQPAADTLEKPYTEDPFLEEMVHEDKGVALWNKEHPEFQQLFAMHRHARINSMLEITNPMFNRTIHVKVVGKIPRTFSDDITVVVSPGVARTLGAIDSRFYVRLRYVK